MANPKPLTNDEGEVRELTQTDFERAVPFTALPDDLKALLASPARTLAPGTAPPKKERNGGVTWARALNGAGI